MVYPPPNDLPPPPSPRAGPYFSPLPGFFFFLPPLSYWLGIVGSFLYTVNSLQVVLFGFFLDQFTGLIQKVHFLLSPDSFTRSCHIYFAGLPNHRGFSGTLEFFYIPALPPLGICVYSFLGTLVLSAFYYRVFHLSSPQLVPFFSFSGFFSSFFLVLVATSALTLSFEQAMCPSCVARGLGFQQFGYSHLDAFVFPPSRNVLIQVRLLDGPPFWGGPIFSQWPFYIHWVLILPQPPPPTPPPPPHTHPHPTPHPPLSVPPLRYSLQCTGRLRKGSRSWESGGPVLICLPSGLPPFSFLLKSYPSLFFGGIGAALCQK